MLVHELTGEEVREKTEFDDDTANPPGVLLPSLEVEEAD